MSQSGGLGRKYLYSRDAQLFAATPPTPTTTFTGQTSYVATTPTFMIYQLAVPTSRRTIPLKMRLTQSGALAGGVISVAVKIDRTNRYSSGGTVIVPAPKAASALGASAPAAIIRANATASAEPETIGALDSFEVVPAAGAMLEYDFDGEVQIGPSNSILIYTWAASTGPTWKVMFEFAEEQS